MHRLPSCRKHERPALSMLCLNNNFAVSTMSLASWLKKHSSEGSPQVVWWQKQGRGPQGIVRICMNFSPLAIFPHVFSCILSSFFIFFHIFDYHSNDARSFARLRATWAEPSIWPEGLLPRSSREAYSFERPENAGRWILLVWYYDHILCYKDL